MKLHIKSILINYKIFFKLLLFISIWSCSSQTQDQQNNFIQNIASNDSDDQDFTNFLKKFHFSVSLQTIYEIPEVPWGRISGQSPIESFFMQKFIYPCLSGFDNPQDSLLINFNPDNKLRKWSGYYLGKIQHSQEDQWSILLIELFERKKHNSTKIIILGYFNTHTGIPLGYDIVAGAEGLRSTIHGRLKLVDKKLIIEKLFFFKKNQIKAQKYTVSFENSIKKKAFKLSKLPQTNKTNNIKNINYQLHCDPITRSCINLPFEFFIFGGRISLENADELFISKDQKASLLVSRNTFVEINNSEDFRKLYLGEIQNLVEVGNEISYDFFTKDFYIISGLNNEGNIFYKKTVFRANILTEASLTYPPDQKELYNKIAAQLYESFEPNMNY